MQGDRRTFLEALVVGGQHITHSGARRVGQEGGLYHTAAHQRQGADGANQHAWASAVSARVCQKVTSDMGLFSILLGLHIVTVKSLIL